MFISRISLAAVGMLAVSDAVAQTVVTPPAPTEAAADAAPAEVKLENAQGLVTKLSVTLQFEQAAGKLALEKSSNIAIREFAQALVTDYSNIDQRLFQVLNLSTTTRATLGLDDVHQQWLDKLKAANGAEFNGLFINIHAEKYNEIIPMLTTYASKGDDLALQNFAIEILPVLERHFTLLEPMLPK
jgi:putative membrane protein